MLVKHWLPLVKPDLNPYFRRGTLARAGGGVWLISHSCYRNINKMVNKIFSQMVGLMVLYHGKNGWFPSSESPNFQWFAPHFGRCLVQGLQQSKTWASRASLASMVVTWWLGSSLGGSRGSRGGWPSFCWMATRFVWCFWFLRVFQLEVRES